MTDPTISCDPGGIARVGWQFRGVAGKLTTAVSPRQVQLTVPGGTNPGWASGPMATAVTTEWQAYLTQLAGRVATFGDDLVTTGTDLQATDLASAKAM